MRKAIKTILVLVAVVSLSACATRSSRYALLNPELIGSIPGGDTGTKWGAFRLAAQSRTFAEAAERWQSVLDEHYKPDDFEDGLDVNMWLLAQQELMRALYATGQTAEADKILKVLCKHR